MSDNSGSQSKTEQPTPKKLRDLRRKGEIPVSVDFGAVLSLLVMVLALVVTGNHLVRQLMEGLDHVMLTDWRLLVSHEAVAHTSRILLLAGLRGVLPLLGLLILSSFAIGWIQAGGLFAVARVQPDLKRIDPVAGVKRMFALRTLFDLAKLLFKSLCLALIVYLLARQIVGVLFNVRFLPVNGVLLLVERFVGQLMSMSLAVFVPLAIADLAYRRWSFRRDNRMTKDEVVREFKEMEGDPHLRAKRKQLQNELGMQQMLENVRKADVVIVNPTHIAVALYYRPDETDIPVVLAKGTGYVAEEIRRVAGEAGVPILRDVQLARQLESQVPVNQYIPEDLIEPVAAVLRWVRDMKRDA